MRLRRVSLPVVVGVAALMLAPTASAERFAEDGGNGPAATCPAADPCDITTAIEDATVVAGEIITIMPGTYNLAAGGTLSPLVNPVTIRGLPGGARPRIIVDDEAFDVGAGTVLRELFIQSTNGSPSVLGNGSTLERLEVQAVDPATEAVRLMNGAVLRDSFASTNRDGAAADTVRALIGGATITNVTAIGLGDNADGVVAEPENQTVIVRNVIARGTGVQGEGVRVESAAMINLDVITSFSNYSSFIEQEPEGDFIDGGGNQTPPPAFVNPSVAVRDFHQLPGSVTIDMGSPFASTGIADVDGQARIAGCALDIGGDELPSICPTQPLTPASPAAAINKKKRKCKKKKKKGRSAAVAAKRKCKKKKKKKR
jgi:hypothetical protein